MKRRVVITGIGLLSPLGNDVTLFWGNMKKGLLGIKNPNKFTLIGKANKEVGLIREFNPEEYFSKNEINTTDVISQHVLATCKKALEDAFFDNLPNDGNKFICAFGSCAGMVPLPERLDPSKLFSNLPPIYSTRIMEFRNQVLIDNLCTKMNITCPGITLFSNCSAGLNAIGYGFEALRWGRADVAIVGGYELFRPLFFSALSDEGLLTKDKCRPFDRNRDGMYIGEGVGVIILEEERKALKTGKKIYGEIIGFGMGCDAYYPGNFSTGRSGSFKAVASALLDAEVDPNEVDYIIADAKGLKGIKDGDGSEAHALKRVFGDNILTVPVSSLKPQLTHTMGASGPLSLIAGLFCLRENIVLPTKNYEIADSKIDLNIASKEIQEKTLNIILVNAIGLGGNASTILVRKC